MCFTTEVNLKFEIYPEPFSIHKGIENKIVCTKSFASGDQDGDGLVLPSLAEMEKLFQSEDLASQPLACAIKKCKENDCRKHGQIDLLKGNFWPLKFP